MTRTIPVGYLAKRVAPKPEFLKAPQVVDVFSVSACTSEDFADYIQYWNHNGYWLFDSPEIIRALATKHAISLDGVSLFYYEAYDLEFDGQSWCGFTAQPGVKTHIAPPAQKQLEGFDVVSFSTRRAPECSPLSCNLVAERVATNSHCLFTSFEEAHTSLTQGVFQRVEPGPYRIFAVYSVTWQPL